jgi:hypothetical protein
MDGRQNEVYPDCRGSHEGIKQISLKSRTDSSSHGGYCVYGGGS